MLTRHQIRVIYEEGVESVTQTIRQLYEMIETDDERGVRQRFAVMPSSA